MDWVGYLCHRQPSKISGSQSSCIFPENLLCFMVNAAGFSTKCLSCPPFNVVKMPMPKTPPLYVFLSNTSNIILLPHNVAYSRVLQKLHGNVYCEKAMHNFKLFCMKINMSFNPVFHELSEYLQIINHINIFSAFWMQPCSQRFIRIGLFTSVKYTLLLLPFYRWANWDLGEADQDRSCSWWTAEPGYIPHSPTPDQGLVTAPCDSPKPF